MLDFCGEHHITADVEVIPIQKVNEAYDRLLRSDVKYRFSIDMASLKGERVGRRFRLDGLRHYLVCISDTLTHGVRSLLISQNVQTPLTRPTPRLEQNMRTRGVESTPSR